jgi:PAS domain S-box-containing protein
MTSQTAPDNGPSAGKTTVNILLVDDEARNLDVLESILASPSYHLVRVQTAQDALMELLDGDFAVIVLDIQMPGTSGIELAHLIKQRKRTQHIPIIFLTAYFHEDKDILHGYQVGAVDYLTKPVDSQILKSKISVFVELFRKTRDLIALNAAMEAEIAQREKAEEALRQAKTQLESRVEERTAELTQAMQNLRDSEKRYRQLVGSLPAAVYTTDAEGRVTLYNEAAAVLWGRRPEVGKDVWCGSHRIYNPDGTPLAVDECPMAVTLRKGHSVRGQEIIIERPDGVRRNVLPYPDPIRDGAGRIVGAVNMLLDITESKLAEQASRRLAAIVEHSSDAIISKDLNGIIVTWNRGAERLFGYEAAEVIGKPITILIPKDHWNEEPAILERVRRGEVVDHYETVRQRKDGSLLEISLTVSPIRDVHGKVTGASKIVRDITEQKRAARELERAHREVVAASRAKDDFLATLSHELRTPLNPVLLLASEAAENQALSADIRKQFAVIRSNVELEARLIDDLLDMTRIRHGKLSLNLGLVDAHKVLKDAFETVGAEFEQNGVKLITKLEARHSRVQGDAVRLQQVIWNLLKNAVKFTPAGGSVFVQTRNAPVDGELVVEIRDTGMGMTGSELARAFEAFTQGEHGSDGASPRFGGLGLGLAISRKLVEAHSGNISAASEGRGKGSSFTITLPSATEETEPGGTDRRNGAAAKSPADKPVDEINILLVEDHEPTRSVLAHLLKRRRYQVHTAASLAEARTLSRSQDFHLLISDIGLPDGDGIGLMKELQEHNRALRGIALSGYGMEQDVARSLEAGFVSHLVKPVRIESLESALATAVAALGS